jgi:ABC-type transporter Mla MlaB component
MASGPIILDCSCLERWDAATIDRIARLHLAAKRKGSALQLANVDADLLELIDFCGLAAVLGVEAGRELKEGKQPLCIEEEGELPDASV